MELNPTYAGPPPAVAQTARVRALTLPAPDAGSGCGCKGAATAPGTTATAATTDHSSSEWRKRDPLDADDIIKGVVQGLITAVLLAAILRR